jgi:phosphoenolpyruvate carboxylase
MAAAAPSGAVAAPATRPSSRKPPGTVRGQIRLTEQGEVIGSKYANPEIGRRNLETLVAATLEATLLQPTKPATKAFLAAAAQLSQSSMAAYRALIYDTPGFTDYFFSSTPIREIAQLNIGSRPASRKPTTRIEDLRAVPWSFSWGQCRLTLPGWYGFGSAVRGFLDDNPQQTRKEGIALLQKMYRQWPFFKTLLSNMDMVLAKSDLALASRYSELVADTRLRKRIFTSIEAEWHATADALALITGEKNRLAGNPGLQRSIRHRFPYIDPLHHLQVELVRRHREGKSDDRVQRGIHISINGIAAGLRNTG